MDHPSVHSSRNEHLCASHVCTGVREEKDCGCLQILPVTGSFHWWLRAEDFAQDWSLLDQICRHVRCDVSIQTISQQSQLDAHYHRDI